MSTSAAGVRTRVTVVFDLAHPHWRGDGCDEDVAVQTLEDGLRRAIGLEDSYYVDTVETDEPEGDDA